MALRQIAGMLDQWATGFHLLVLQAGQRSRLDPTGKIIQSASQDELQSTDGKSELREPVKSLLVNGLHLEFRVEYLPRPRPGGGRRNRQ